MASKYDKYKNEWVYLYKQGNSAVKIACRYNCVHSTVYKVLKRNGVSRPQGETLSLISKMKYVDIDTYFDVIDTEEKVYYLGLIVADGCIQTPKGGRQQIFSLGLQIGDGYIVDRLAKILGRNVQVIPAKGNDKECRKVYAYSNHICNTLKGYGITNKKSLDNHEAKIFNHIPPELMRHFIRGIVDGDGCIYITNDKRYNSRTGCVTVVGNKQDMQAVSDVFSSIGCKNKTPRKVCNIYEVKWAAKADITRIIHYLYDDATIYLTRKKDIADEILALYENRDAAKLVTDDREKEIVEEIDTNETAFLIPLEGANYVNTIDHH
jgi:ribosomal protein L20A (L18A)